MKHISPPTSIVARLVNPATGSIGNAGAAQASPATPAGTSTVTVTTLGRAQVRIGQVGGAGNPPPPVQPPVGGSSQGQPPGSAAGNTQSDTATLPQQNKGSWLNNLFMSLIVILFVLMGPTIATIIISSSEDGFEAISNWILLILVKSAWATFITILWKKKVINWVTVPRNNTGTCFIWNYKLRAVFSSGSFLTFGKVQFLPSDFQKKQIRNGDAGIDITVHGSRRGDTSETTSQIPAKLKANLTYVIVDPNRVIDEIGLKPTDEKVLWVNSDTEGDVPEDLSHKKYLENKFMDNLLFKLRHEVFPRINLEDILMLNGHDDSKSQDAKARLDDLLTQAICDLNELVGTLVPGIQLGIITVTKVEVDEEMMQRLEYATAEAFEADKGATDTRTSLRTMQMLKQGVKDKDGKVEIQGADPDEALFMSMMSQPDKWDPKMGVLGASLMAIAKGAIRAFASKK